MNKPPACREPDEPFTHSTPEPIELVSIFQTADPILLALAKAALEAEGIPFVTQGEGVQDLIGFGRLPGGFNLATGPVRIHVPWRVALRARQVLAEIENPRASHFWFRVPALAAWVGSGLFLAAAVLRWTSQLLIVFEASSHDTALFRTYDSFAR